VKATSSIKTQRKNFATLNSEAIYLFIELGQENIPHFLLIDPTEKGNQSTNITIA
jgi:hypothetical protein